VVGWEVNERDDPVRRQRIPGGRQAGGDVIGNRCWGLKSEITQYPGQHAVIGMLAAASRGLDMSLGGIARRADAVIEQQIGGGQPEVSRDIE